VDTATVAFLLLVIGIHTVRYRRSDALQRRRGRWILLGLYVALLPMAAVLVSNVFLSLDPPLFPMLVGIGYVALAALPVSILVSIL
jgi:hypothetical protein